MRPLFVAIAALGMALTPVTADARSLKIVASFSILADMVREVAGPFADITAMVGPGGDAHTFNPSPSDAGKFAGADLIFVNGLGLDGWMQPLAQSADFTGEIVTASQDITPRHMTETDGGAKRLVTDPHAWQDPRNGGLYIRTIALALAKADPLHSAEFARGADKLVADLDLLDIQTRARLANVAIEKRKVITSHDAFGYFSAAYGVALLAPEGISTDQEPSAGAVARLIDQIRMDHIRAVFIENMTDPRLIEAICAETGAPDSGTLYSDALSLSDGPAPTYLAMLHYNIDKLIYAMQRN